jgi:Lipid A core - O-antigen ligase and related enzymes
MSDYKPLTNPRERRKSPDDQGFSDEFQTRFAEGDFARSATPNIAPESATAKPRTDDTAKEKKTASDRIGSVQDFLKRGHVISFVGLLLFTAFVYFRPYEYSASLAFLSSGAKWIAGFTLLIFLPSQLALEGNLTSRPPEVNLLLLLTLLALLSLITAISLSEAWDNVVEYLKVVAMFIVMVNVVRTEGRLRWMLWIALAVSVTTSIGAISDYQAGRLLTGGERIKGSIGGLFENPNDLALHLATIVPLAVSLFVGGRHVMKLIYLACGVLMIAAIICTFSRAGFLGLIAASLVLAWKLGRKNRTLVIIGSLIAIAAVVVLAPAEYGGRLNSIWGGGDTGSANARQELFWRSLLVALRYPLLGVGMGNFHFRSIHEQVSHNSFTQVGSELGIPAAILYVLFMITSIKRLRHIERETLGSKENAKFYYLSVGLQASLVGYMVASFFASVAFLWYIYYLVGYAVCVSRLYATVKAKEEVAEMEGPASYLG